MTALQILRQALVELERPDYESYKDRALSMLDEACRSLLPVAGRTPAQHSDVVAQRQEAQCLIGHTLIGRPVSEKESCLALHELGGISQADLWILINKTLTRLGHTTPLAIAAE